MIVWPWADSDAMTWLTPARVMGTLLTSMPRSKLVLLRSEKGPESRQENPLPKQKLADADAGSGGKAIRAATSAAAATDAGNGWGDMPRKRTASGGVPSRSNRNRATFATIASV